MKVRFYILQLDNIGENEIFLAKGQPEDGFSSKPDAIQSLKRLIEKGEYPYTNGYKFIITELYTKNK